MHGNALIAFFFLLWLVALHDIAHRDLLFPGSGMGEARGVSGCAKEWVVTA